MPRHDGLYRRQLADWRRAVAEHGPAGLAAASRLARRHTVERAPRSCTCLRRRARSWRVNGPGTESSTTTTRSNNAAPSPRTRTTQRPYGGDKQRGAHLTGLGIHVKAARVEPHRELLAAAVRTTSRQGFGGGDGDKAIVLIVEGVHGRWARPRWTVTSKVLEGLLCRERLRDEVRPQFTG